MKRGLGGVIPVWGITHFSCCSVVAIVVAIVTVVVVAVVIVWEGWEAVLVITENVGLCRRKSDSWLGHGDIAGFVLEFVIGRTADLSIGMVVVNLNHWNMRRSFGDLVSCYDPVVHGGGQGVRRPQVGNV